MDNMANKFEHVLLGIANNLKKHGIDKGPVITQSEFASLPIERQCQILRRSSLQLEQMELLDPSLSQKDYINTLCLFHRLKPSSEDIYNRLTDDIVWEILDFDFNQIYRSKLIYKLTNYRISQMEEYTPFELYDRPKRVLEQLMEVVNQLKLTKKIVEMKHIKPYILKELMSEARGMLQIQHDFVCPLLDSETNELKAFVAGFTGIKLPVSKDLGSNILLMN